MLAGDVIAAEQLVRGFAQNGIENAPTAVQLNSPLPVAAENKDGRVKGDINNECHICTFVSQVSQNPEMFSQSSGNFDN